jgi:predicted N-formylglutamate amidohydrolase
MKTVWTELDGAANSALLLIGDHAANHVPAALTLGLSAAQMASHIAWDIGVAPLARALCGTLDCPAILGAVSRLVVDLNREEDAPQLIPLTSDGHTIPGNALTPAERVARIARYWRPYHARIAAQIAVQRPTLLISLHSFTPQLESRRGEARPWEVGILYNNDDRAARIALPLLAAAGVVAGDQLPYSGKLLNATMNRHGEGTGTAYLGIEMRQDLIGDPRGVARWAERLVPVIMAVTASLIPPGYTGAETHRPLAETDGDRLRG